MSAPQNFREEHLNLNAAPSWTRSQISRVIRYGGRQLEMMQSHVRKTMIRLKYPSCRFGRRVFLGPGVVIRSTDGAVIEIGDDTVIQANCILVAKYGCMRIGARTFIGWGAVLCANESIIVGEDTLIAEHVTVRDHNHVPAIDDSLTKEQPMKTRAISLGNNVWIGAKASILLGASIGRDAVVGANAVVVSAVPSQCVVAGVPAKVIRRLSKESI